MVGDELAARLRDAVSGLTDLQREVFALRVNDGMAYAEIAQVVGSTEGACRVHYHNALKAIKERVRDD
jgi:RNA polymerase sigma-70 factor (ECF subfamily)